jgi:nicotinate-nucleotide adenylyltransferase
MRIGLLGGSFNPAHAGHLHVSRQALKQLRLDRIWWLVSPQNPLKPEKGMASFAARVAGARAVARDPRIAVTPLEAELDTRYTIDTVAALQRRMPQLRFVWLMGGDNLVQLPRWKKWDALVRRVPIAVVPRPGSARSARTAPVARRFATAFVTANADFAERPAPALTFLEGPRSTESATRLRTAKAASARSKRADPA